MLFRELSAVVVLAGAMFFRMFGVFVALPVAAVFASLLPGGAAGWIVGIAVGGYGITQALLQMPAGMLADVVGRKPVMIGLLLVFALGGFVAAEAETVWQLAAGRLLQGGGAVAAVAAAWISDITAPERRAPAMMVYGSAIALAFVASLFAAPGLAGEFGVPAIFSLSGWLGVMSAIAVALLPAPPKHSGKQQIKTQTPAGESTARASAIHQQVVYLAVAAFASHYALSALFLQTPLLLLNDLPLGEHWRVYAPAFLLSLAASVPLVFAKKRRSGAAAFALLAAGSALSWSDSGLWWSGAGLCLFFAGFTALEALIPAIASRSAPPDKRGTALGVVMSAEFAGMFCGAAASGGLSDVVGPGGAFAALIFCISVGFGIMTQLKESNV